MHLSCEKATVAGSICSHQRMSRFWDNGNASRHLNLTLAIKGCCILTNELQTKSAAGSCFKLTPKARRQLLGAHIQKKKKKNAYYIKNGLWPWNPDNETIFSCNHTTQLSRTNPSASTPCALICLESDGLCLHLSWFYLLFWTFSTFKLTSYFINNSRASHQPLCHWLLLMNLYNKYS